jgi:hypothetical protein
VVWRVNSPDDIRGPFELPSDGDGSGSSANALNDGDDLGIAQVVGYRSSPVSGEGGDFLWDVQLLVGDIVPISTTPIGLGTPIGINNGGLVVGRIPGFRETEAYAWLNNSTWFLDRGRGKNKVPYAAAWDINDSGLIVGEARTDTSIGALGRACFWNGVEGSLTYLDGFLPTDSPITELYHARAVNAFGDIIGHGSSNFVAVKVTQ